LQPTCGSVLFDGKQSEKLKTKESARLMAVVPQDTGVDYDFTVEEIVSMGRYPHEGDASKSERDHREIVESSMKITGILSLKNRLASTLSGGERQRMVFARALCQEPKLLLLDEPTANLDIGYQWELLDIVSHLNRERQVTVIAAIHDLNLATLFFRKFMLIAKGKIVAVGNAEEVLTKENILASYGVEASVFRHPLHGRLQISIGQERMNLTEENTVENKIKVHVIGGGHEALPVMEALWEEGYRISLGPVSREDSGFQLAQYFNIPLIENPPFTTIGNETNERHLAMMRDADMIVLPPISFGEGNLRNLEAMAQAMQGGVPGVVVGGDMRERDFAGGRAVALAERLKALGVVFVGDIAALLQFIKNTAGKKTNL
jgi:iron complex transport system ATP-binding protein